MLSAGTIDCADSYATTANIAENACQVITEAKKYCDMVIMSSILPRDNRPIQNKIDTVNDYIKKICKEQDRCSFIDNYGSFKLANQNQNESLFL